MHLDFHLQHSQFSSEDESWFADTAKLIQRNPDFFQIFCIVAYSNIHSSWQTPLPVPNHILKQNLLDNEHVLPENPNTFGNLLPGEVHHRIARDTEAQAAEEAKYKAQQEAQDIEKYRAQVNNAHLWGGLDTGGLYRGLPKNLQNLTDLLILESKDPKYNDFFSWVFQNLVDPGDHAERMKYKMKNIPADVPSILRTTEFPIPEKLQVFYAIVIHLDRLRGKVPGHIVVPSKWSPLLG